MVKMSLGNSTSQGSAISSISSSRISAYNGAISSLNSFIGASHLQGDAYNSAKKYASTVLIPLIQGAILLSEAINHAVNQLPSRYTSEVAGESLDSEVLEAQIATYQAAYSRSSAWLTSEMSKKVLNERSILRAQQSMTRNLNKIDELQEKLDKLMAFNASSPKLFDEIASLKQAVTQGFSQVNNSFSSYNGTFSLPSKEELTWTTTIATAWGEREKLIAENAVSEEFDETIANIADESGLTVEEVMAYILYGKEPISNTKKAQKFLATYIKYQKGKAFLKGKAITVEYAYAGTKRQSIRVRWGGKPLYDQKTGQLFKTGKELKEKTGIDLSKDRIALTPEGKFNLSEIWKAGKSSFKSAINPLSDFKGWKEASNFAKFGKALGIAGTAMTVINNVNADFINADGGINSVKNWKNFAIDTSVDLVSGAGVTGAGAAFGATAGSLFAPPLGTVGGALLGQVMFSFMLNDVSFLDGKSITTMVKDNLKGWFN